MSRLISGKEIANKKMEEIRNKFSDLKDEHGLIPHLKLIQLGDVESSTIYANTKIKRGKKLGVEVSLDRLPSSYSEKDLRSEISKYANDPSIHGIMVETPLPSGMNFYSVVEEIPFYKDVDGMSPFNQGRISVKNEFLNPGTPSAVVTLLEQENLNPGDMVTIINRSPIVGKPLSHMLLNRDFTVNVCHSKTKNIREMAKMAQVVVVAVGRIGFLDKSYVTEDSIVIDVGINYTDTGIVGDADFEEIKDYVKAITPVPGGVGPLTSTFIFENLLKAVEFQLAGK